MPSSETEAREELSSLATTAGLSTSAIAAKCGKNYLWVWRRLVGKTSLKVADYNLIRAAITQ